MGACMVLKSVSNISEWPSSSETVVNERLEETC